MVAPMIEQVTAAERVAAVGSEIVLGSVVIRLKPGASAQRIALDFRALTATT